MTTEPHKLCIQRTRPGAFSTRLRLGVGTLRAPHGRPALDRLHWTLGRGALAWHARPVDDNARAKAEPRSLPTAKEVLLERVRVTYAALKTYSDAGEVTTEEQPIGSHVIVERYAFRTRYAKAPRRFLFECTKGAAVGGERFVVWSPGDVFNSWWSATGVHEAYRPGEGANAFAVGALPTAGALLVVPPVLFDGAGLEGPLTAITSLRYLRREQIAGRTLHVISGSARLNHWSDSVRPTTLWIDATTLMIRKVVEDTPSGSGGALQRVTTVLEPRANPPLASSAFNFSPQPLP